MVVCASPEWDEATQGPREVVAAVGLERLQDLDRHPGKQGDNVKVTCQGHPDNGQTSRSETKDEGFCRVGVLGGDRERRGEVWASCQLSGSRKPIWRLLTNRGEFCGCFCKGRHSAAPCVPNSGKSLRKP